MTSAPVTIRPVRLELNRRGAWQQVIGFDASDEEGADAAMSGAQLLCHIGGGKWRLCTDEPLPMALMYLNDPVEGWVPARSEAP